MTAILRYAVIAALFAGLTLGAASQREGETDVFASFWAARDPDAAARTMDAIEKSGATFAEVLQSLKRGRPYARDVQTGAIQGIDQTRWFIEPVAADVPLYRRRPEKLRRHSPIPGADPPARWRHAQSLGRPDAGRHRIARGHDRSDLHPAGGLGGRALVGTRQVENLRAILDSVKRTYNVDENRVTVSGVSDGGTGAFYVAMADTTPYSALRVTQRLRDGPSQRAPRRGRSLSEQPARQALVRREWRPRSAVPDVDGRAVPVAPLSRRRLDRIPPAAGGGTRDVVVAKGQGRAGRVPRAITRARRCRTG